ncbi:MAG TPA: alpha/beta hydrolase [Ktedonobacteraceae bacterium]
MNATRIDTLRVPGASLYYEVRGSGPVLLLIGAGAADAASFNGITTHLAERYTVVSYDRRGYSRSPLDDREAEQRLETHSDDAHRLLTILGTEPASVFGSSGGALIGLDLAIRYPEQIRTLVSHEPPVGELLPDAERPHLPLRDLQQFAASIGVRYDNREPDAEMPNASPEAKARLAANRAFFLAHEVPMYPRYTLAIAALAAAPIQIVIAAGQASRRYFPYRIATLLSERLGTAVVEFPSHHAGYVSHPRAFAEQLYHVLSEESGT